MKKLLICLLAVMLFGTMASAQDKIYRKNGEVITVKVLEVSSSEVKYRIFGSADDSPIYVLERDRIKKIEYADGRVEKPSGGPVDLKDPEQYTDQKRNAVKVSFLGPLFGFTQFTYERSTGIGKAVEASFTIIGAGKNKLLDYNYYGGTTEEVKKDQFGFGVAFGYKFNKLPDFLFGRTRFTHIMQGGYVRPVIYMGNYKENMWVYKAGSTIPVIEKQTVTFGALQLELGKQWVFGESFVMDLYGGFGYGVDNKKSEIDDGAYNYLNQRLGDSPGFSLNGGLKIGVLF